MNTRKLFAGIAAAATLFGGLALGAGTANAADPTITLKPATITVKATDPAQLTGRQFKAVKLGDYSVQSGPSLNLTTVADDDPDTSASVRDAIDTILAQDNQWGTAKKYTYEKDGGGDPLVWLGTQYTSGSADHGYSEQGWDGIQRDFVTDLAGSQIVKNAFAAAPVLQGDATVAKQLTFTFNDPGMYLIEDVTGADATVGEGANATLPMLVGTKVTASEGVTLPALPWPADEQSGVVYIKNSIVSVESKTSDHDSSASVGVGETVTYRVRSTVPVSTGYDNFTFAFKDVPSAGLTIAGKDIHVFVDGNASGSTEKGDQYVDVSFGKDKTFVGDGTKSFTVTVSDLSNISASGKSRGIELVYKATVTESAPDVTGTYDKEVTNKASVAANGGAYSAEVAATPLRLRGLKFTKVQGDGTTPLPGAQFQIRGDKDGEPLKFVKQGDAFVLSAAEDAQNYVTSGQDGSVIIKGLNGVTSDYYYAKESKVPAGYSSTAIPEFSFAFESISGETTVKPLDVTGLVTVAGDNGKATAEKLTITVKNIVSITELPLTGAAGIALFSVIAAALVGAGVFGAARLRSVRAGRSVRA